MRAPRHELAAFAERQIAKVAEQGLMQEALLDAEPLAPPSSPRDRRAWEARLRDRRAAIRLGVTELAQLTIIEQGCRAAPGHIDGPE